jgi:hypothetical protein
MAQLRQLLDVRNAASSVVSGPIVAAPSPTLCGHALQRPDAANARTCLTLDTDSDDGWGSDFNEDELTPAERTLCLARFDREERQMAGRMGDPPPVPPRQPAK